jgi:hypothetical protein
MEDFDAKRETNSHSFAAILLIFHVSGIQAKWFIAFRAVNNMPLLYPSDILPANIEQGNIIPICIF